VEKPFNGTRKIYNSVLPTKQLIDGDELSDHFIYLKLYMEEKISTLNDEEFHRHYAERNISAFSY
jgi:hypothetical protein